MVDQEVLHTQWYNKTGDVVVVMRSPKKEIMSVQHVGNGIQKMEVNGYNVPFVDNGFTKPYI